MANKNSIYVQSLVDFILDTKPYRSKLTEIVEEYRFSDSMTVHIDETLFSTVMTKAAWPYSYFSGGVSIPAPTMPLKQIVSPLFRELYKNSTPSENRGAFKARRDENTDLPLVPFAFDPKSLQGTGINDVFVQRGGVPSLSEPLLEGHDFFQSQGAYVFQIKQTLNSQSKITGRFNHVYSVVDVFPITVTLSFVFDSLVVTGPAAQSSPTQLTVTGPGAVKAYGVSNLPNYEPLFTERANENLIAQATTVVQQQALDTANPTSAVNRLKALMTSISAQLLLTPCAPADVELTKLNLQLAVPVLPASYEALLNALIAGNTPIIAGFAGWRGQDVVPPYANQYVNQALDQYSPALYFNEYSDVKQRESGELVYRDLVQGGLTVSNIVSDPARRDYEEWTLEVATASSFVVRGSITGVIDSAMVGTHFTSPQLSFTTNNKVLTVGDLYLLTPNSKITVHQSAALEAWSLIKVNPLAYSRPTFSSTRYGYLTDQTGALNKITLLDITLPTGAVVLTALNNSTFLLTDTADVAYTGTVTVNVPYNDGRTAFTIHSGSSYQFSAGDKFIIEIQNDPAVADELDLFYGYDVDSYDAGNLVYNNVDSSLADYLKALDFNFDSRFTSYDFATFNLALTQNTVNNRQYRLRALPDFTRPLPLQNTAPGTVNQIGTNDPTNPNASTQFTSVNDVTADGQRSATDPALNGKLELWYSSVFELEYFDTGTGAWSSIDAIPVGSPYNNDAHGISFKLVNASKPFIASKLHSSMFTSNTGPFSEEDVFGGDVFSWTIRNNPPAQTEPASIVGSRVPRLIMHGNSFNHSVPAKYVLNWVNSSTYTIQGFYSTGDQNGSPISAPVTVRTADGLSYRDDVAGVHYTIVLGQAGLNSADGFKFETYESKPSYLVYGSISGWQPNAELNKWYWNGKIGFKLSEPRVQAFENSMQLTGVASWSTSVGTVRLNRIRRDAVTSTYTLRSQNNNHWTLYRSGAVVAEGVDTVADQYLSLSVPTGVAGTAIVFQVDADEHELTLGHDLAIIRTTAGRAPSALDFVLIERAEADGLLISIQAKDPAHADVLRALGRTAIDARFIDHSTRSGVPLQNTSPETAIQRGWIPTLLDRRDRGLSTAEFSDPATHVVVRAAATGEVIGTVQSIGPEPAEPVIFKWDSAFHQKYLPLNAESLIVTLGSGLNESMSVNMREGIMFLLSGGGLNDDALFSDYATVHMMDADQWAVHMAYAADIGVAVSDGPFIGFLPGYDNLPYDLETGVDGSYDTGVALSGYFADAQALAALSTLSPAQQARLNDLVDQLSPYLYGGSLANTSFSDFIAALAADPNIGAITPDFGIPAVGLGIDIQDSPGTLASAAVIEAMTVFARDSGYQYDQYGFDVGPLDVNSETTAIVYSNSLPPLPASGLPPAGTAYGDFDTPLMIQAPGARIIEISFVSAPVGTPSFYIWRPTASAPEAVPVVERVNTRLFRFSLPAPTELKVVVG